ncbi:MAG: tRNA 2-thiocytidine biosynthesis protein TtcA [Clostridiales bacterium]|nr:tRNA 2-thiocytidine biosynthesis protein TtcA [Clostridiales bacterium]
MEQYQQTERSIIKKYRKSIWNRFVEAVKTYRLIEEGDRIAVCISGGKDSMLLAKCMQELHQHSDVPFEAVYLVMDPGYRTENRHKLLMNAELLRVPVEVFDAPIFNFVAKQEKSPCYLCARMRRGYLYQQAQARGCNKIALGHHFDDVIETILMSMLFGAEMRTMMPKLHSTNFPGMELIRPLYLVKEQDIIAWTRYNGLSFLQCACRFTERTGQDDAQMTSMRREVKELIASLRKLRPNIDYNIFHSAENVNLETLISYRDCCETHHFLDGYMKEGGRGNGHTGRDL